MPRKTDRELSQEDPVPEDRSDSQAQNLRSHHVRNTAYLEPPESCQTECIGQTRQQPNQIEGVKVELALHDVSRIGATLEEQQGHYDEEEQPEVFHRGRIISQGQR